MIYFQPVRLQERSACLRLCAEHQEKRIVGQPATDLKAIAKRMINKRTVSSNPTRSARSPMLSLSKRAFTPVFDGRRAERKVSAPHPPCMTLLSHGAPV